MRKHLAIAAAVLAMAAAGSPARATPLPAGGTVLPDASPETGTLIATMSNPFSVPIPGGGGVDAGTIVASVYLEPGGTLNFDYQLTSNTGTNSLESISTFSFAGFATDVSAVVNGAFLNQLAPMNATRSLTEGGPTVRFQFLGAHEIPPGSTSMLLIVRTDATLYKTGSVTVQDGGTFTGVGFSPAVPEPSSVVMMSSGFVAICGAALRRRVRTTRPV